MERRSDARHQELRYRFRHRRPSCRALNQITRVLKFDGKVEGGRNVNAFVVDTLLVSAAEINLVGPEAKTRRIRLAVKEIEIVQAYEEPGGVVWVDAAGC